MWFKNSIYAIRVVDNAGKRALVLESKEDRYTVSFDKTPMQATMVRETIGGTQTTELAYENFTNEDGIMLPHRVTIKFPGFTQVMEDDDYYMNQEAAPRRRLQKKGEDSRRLWN